MVSSRHEQLLFSKKQEEDLIEIRLSSVTRLLLDTYVFKASNYQLSPLLDVIALGPTRVSPISFYSSNRGTDFVGAIHNQEELIQLKLFSIAMDINYFSNL
jgi:hypothetical protein